MRSVYALIPAALLAGTVLAAPAHASNKEDPGAHAERISAQKKHFKKTTGLKATGKTRKTASLKKRKQAHAKTRKSAAVKLRKAGGKPKFAATGLKKKVKSSQQFAMHHLAGTKVTLSEQALAINGAGDARVVSIIREMAPAYGVPTWFALRIANVESGFNPHARGRAGEIGVYQLKCQTARGMGFEGNCSALTDARTNVRWGLKHLSLAIASSGGNLKLAASKHNGGLGRKSLVHSYIAKVF
ncbi:transglycosylase SLT domain-containing protein [Taklimakanibacter lacteus]|uniref:transglycosylase SLT domain-containing protein n=1 Tax=Taklimakanibacter lacteus TaxID=2268456 RepID=UPI000E663215